MIVGFMRGDIQVFEVQRKWERVAHLRKCHHFKIVFLKFFNVTHGKIDIYDALSVDE